MMGEHTLIQVTDFDLFGCAEAKKKLLAPRPEVSVGEFLDEEALARIMEKAKKLEGLEDRIRALTTEENRQKVLIDVKGIYPVKDMKASGMRFWRL